MKNHIKQLLIALALLPTLGSQLSTVFAQGTAFTYQGQLQNNGSPASGTYNLTFTLFNTNTSGVAIAGPVTDNAVAITNGLFTVLIDFGSGVFTGATNWLQLGVESNGASSFTTLMPRQKLTPTPNAIYAESANILSGTLSASQLASIGNSSPNADNFFVGPSGNPATSGIYNTAYGFSALLGDASGSFNTANGAFALNVTTSGGFNTASGAEALGLNISGSYNTADGAYALIYNKSGSNNVAVGYGALEFNTNDNELVAIGSQALQNDNAYGNGSTSDGNGHNTAVGYQALQLNTFGAGNTANGYQALNQNVNGNFNTANGDKALYYNTSGSQNTANGLDALYSNTSGSQNTANGATTLYSNTGGFDNTANGYQALYSNTNGLANTANGAGALYDNTSGFANTANGVDALFFNTSGSNNVAEGFDALEFNTNDNALVAIGYEALQYYAANNQATYSGNGENTAVGYQALQLTTFGSGNTAIGYQALNQNTFGSLNTANGDYALLNNTSGFYNTAVGYQALYSSTNGSSNIAIGYLAGELLANGNYNIYIGNEGLPAESGIIRIGEDGVQTSTFIAGNVGLGGVTAPQQTLSLNGGMNIDQASQNTGTIGANALTFGSGAGEGIVSRRTGGGVNSYGLELWTDFNNRITILQHGNVGIGTTNPANLFVVGGSGSPAYCNGTSWVNGSDRNSKEDFAAINPQSVLAKVSALPITEWKYKVETDGTEHLGPMAQDFHAAFGLNGADDKHIATVDEEGVALAAIQGLNQKVNEKDASIQEQASEIAILKQQNNSLAERLNELEATVKQLAVRK